MNPFGVADSYIDAGYHVVMVDLDGVRKQGLDPAHVVGCQVLGAPCTNGYLTGLENESFEANTDKHDIIDHPFADLSVEDITKMEQLFQFRDWYVLPFESCKNELPESDFVDGYTHNCIFFSVIPSSTFSKVTTGISEQIRNLHSH
jgi:hypothetical protein